MRSKIFSVFLSIMLCSVSLLSGCGSPAASSSEVAVSTHDHNNESVEFNDNTVEQNDDDLITIVGWFEEPYTQYLMAFLADKFPELTFEYKYIAKNSYEPIVDSQLASKLAADIVMVNPNMVKKHGKNGYIVDVTEFTDAFQNDAKEAFSYEEKVYAVPNTSEYQCIFFNRLIFQELGRQIPTTYTAFLGYCDALQSKLGVKPMSAGLKDPDRVADSALAALAAGYFQTEKGSTFGERLAASETDFRGEIKQYLMKWQELITHGIITKEMCIMDNEAAIEEFATGKSFMYVGSVEDYNRIIEISPDIKLGTMGFLSEKYGKEVLLGGHSCGLAVNGYSKKIDEATEVIKLLATQEGQYALWEDRVGSQTYLKNYSFTNPEVFDGLRAMINGKRVYNPTSEWGDHSKELYSVFGEQLQKVILEERTLDVAMQVVDDKLKQLRRKN